MTASFAARIPGIEAITPLQLTQSMEEAVDQQQDRVAEVCALYLVSPHDGSQPQISTSLASFHGMEW